MSIAKTLSVVLPAYNEEENIRVALQKALDCLPRMADEFEVIVVDDGSRDRTAEIAHAMVVENYPLIRLLRHVENRGYGAALRTGFRHARYELVFYTDSDNQFDIAELEYALPMMADHDVVVGFRVYRYDSVLRVLTSHGYNLLVRLLFRVKVRDVDCAFKVFRREVLDKISIECSDFFVDTELVAKARKWNFRIAEKGVRHYPRAAGETTVHPSDIPRTLRTIGAMWRRIHMPRRREMEEIALVHAELDESTVEAIPTAG
jgi:glycosyltransferase involved in cell wall biosynthesis